MIGLGWKRNLEVVLERQRRFFRKEMPDGILATLPAQLDTEAQWAIFEKKWGTYPPSEPRPLNAWTRRFLAIQDYFAGQAQGRFAQHPCLTMDALNFVAEIRGATRDALPEIERLPEMRRAVGDIPIMVKCVSGEFQARLKDGK